MFAAGDEDEDESGEERLPSCFDYVMHFLTVFWKVLFACVPPTEYCNGWACFVVSILIIGMLTAVIGDLASHFGCTIGLKDSVTAVVFVAFGTSVPGGTAVGRGLGGTKVLQWFSWSQRSFSVMGWGSGWEGAPKSPVPRQGLHPTWWQHGVPGHRKGGCAPGEVPVPTRPVPHLSLPCAPDMKGFPFLLLDPQ